MSRRSHSAARSLEDPEITREREERFQREDEERRRAQEREKMEQEYWSNHHPLGCQCSDCR